MSNLDAQGNLIPEGDDPKPGEDPKPGDEPKTGADPKKAEPKDPGPVPYDRFKEVNDKAKAYEVRLAELEQKNLDREKATDKKRQEALKDQEKFKELAEEWEGKYAEAEPKLADSVKELEKANALLQQYADAQMELVPELFREVVSSLPLTERLEWLTVNKDKLGKEKPQGIPATPKGSGSGEITVEERRKQSARTF